MDRRDFLFNAGLRSAMAALALAGCASETRTSGAASISPNRFLHGVASGDPLHDRVILWTRVTPESAGDESDVLVRWWVARDREGTQVVQQGEVFATAARDFTVKADASGLTPDTGYFYGFETASAKSEVGRTHTLPRGRASGARLAVTSCANYPEGFFNAYAHIADRTDLDLVLCLGDYFYEYPNNEYGDGTDLGRVPRPDREVISLADYRLRHATYKLDPDLQAAHAAHPWVVVWDDHESANNSWKGGAENHNPDKGEGDWNDRRLAAVRAYYEWMPIRELPTGLFRSFRIGDLAELIMLDTRLEGRAEQVAAGDNDGAESVERSLLGPIQESAFFEALTEAQQDRVTWKLVGQQVVFAPLIEQSGSFNPDAWDGYRESRRRVLRHIERDRIEGVVVLTGDVHSAWALEVPDEDEAGRLAVELVAPAVSARPLASSERFRQLVENAREQIPHVRYVDGDHNGYLWIELTHEQVVAQWLQTGDPRVRSSETRVGATMRTTHGSNRLQLT